MRRISLSILGVMFLSTIFAAAFLLGTQQVTKKTSPKITASGKNNVPHKSGKKERKTSSSDKFLVMEEYPAEEEKVGFGLEDLIAKTKKAGPKEEKGTGEKSKTKKPLLVLIIDDVSNREQLESIHRLPYHVTPSIFPPSRMNAHSPRLAKGLQHYMIHLPMQSSNPKMNRFTKTMKVGDSSEKIAKRIREIRKLFPTGIFVNNHTGSVFTSNYTAMRRAYIKLKRNGFIFVDSRTTGRSAVRKITKIYHDPYISRDVFIDNVQQRTAILGQLRRAVKIAKKRGYAIAIGHPHHATMEALRHAGKILSQVKVVYIDEFYRGYYGRH
ncbi:divergent polysaccharide deacetylase family protein [Nitratifractor sp.]